MSLKIDWCSRKAAKFCVMNFHYSRSMPAGKVACLGVWEEGKFIGSVIFSRGSTPQLFKPYGLKQNEACELARVALSRNKSSATSQIINRSLKIIKKHSPGVRLCVSFADTEQNHIGTVYQAAGWIYAGLSITDNGGYIINGQRIHSRSMGAKYGYGGQKLEWIRKNLDPNGIRVVGKKHKYIYLFDQSLRQTINSFPYPKRVKQATGGDQLHSGGATPTGTLHAL